MIERLIENFVPENYQLEIDINHDELTFQGKVVISGQTLKLQSSIKIHSKNLEIASARIDDKPTKGITAHKFDVLELTTKNEIEAGQHKVEIKFTGKITDDMVGIYPCYFEHEGKKKWLIATQFESHYAREAFPCIDEPEAKATFDLSLKTKAGNEVLSNMPQLVGSSQSTVGSSKKLKTKDERLTTTFETTPRMSTYLLAFVTGEIHGVEAKTKDGVLVKSWGAVNQPKEQLEFANQEAVNIIEFYDDYFDTKYPLPKCDQVALPDFDAGAMENWGLITYRESVMLVDQKNRSISSEQYCSIVVGHELSHQWFGNLVTMKWWDDLWLNESFASLMEYIAVEALHPQWKIWEDYTASDAVMASNRDVYSDVQPVRIDVNDPAEISSLFDGAIVYAKGGRLLKMLRELIGEEAFREALKNYFKKHAYQNTTRDDLWEAMAESSGKDIKSIMNSWLEQSGLPLISLAQNGEALSIEQKRLLLDENEASDQLWQVPLLANHKLEQEILTKKQQDFTTENSEPVILNQFGSGHFVTRYETEAQRNFVKSGLKNQSIPTEGRINLLNDMILLAKSGNSPLTDALSLIVDMKSEPRDSVWSMMAAIIGNARMLTEGDDETEEKLKQLTYNLVKERYAELGWTFSDNGDSNTKQLRRTILGLAVGSENQMVIDEALSQFKKARPEDLSAEVRSLLMSAAVRFGEKSVVDELISLHKETALPDLKADICVALTSTKDETIAKKLTELIKDPEQVRPQDIVRWYAYLLRNKYSREVIWQWTKVNWAWIMKTFENSKSYDYFPRYAANFMNSEKWLEEYKNFFTPMINQPELTRTIKVGLKEIEARAAWRTRDQQKITDWLNSI